MKNLQICITCDVDPDQATSAKPERTNVTWAGLDHIHELTNRLSDREIPYTLFMRADLQIKSIFGTSHYFFEKYWKLLKNIQTSGSEVGWHPHLVDEINGQFVPLYDPNKAAKQIEMVFGDLAITDTKMTSVRLGEAWHSNQTMHQLDMLGFLVDSTGVPGRIRNDPERVFDWQITPNHPYHPSEADYRRTVNAKEVSLKILEVPMTTGEMRTSYDRKPLRRYLNLAFRPELFKSGLSAYLKYFLSTPTIIEGTLVLTLHPGELLPLPPNDLYGFGWKTFMLNLEQTINLMRDHEIHFQFECISKAGRSR